MDERAGMLAELSIVLDEVGSEHALIGGLAAGHHGRTRATIDVDLLVPGRKLKPLAQALERRGYRVTPFLPDMIRVYPRGAAAEGEAIADLVSKDANPVLRAAFGAVEPAEVLGHRVNLITRGALVALKFHAATSQKRRHGDRLQDTVDIERVITKHFDAEDLAVARSIAEHAYPGAGDDLEKLVDDLRSGRPITI
jgi:hypothetical protein